MANRVIAAFFQFFDSAGDPLQNGWIEFFESGSNSLHKDTYADYGLTIANANPVQLDGDGRCPNVFGSGNYRAILYENDAALDVPGSQIQQFDPVGDLLSSLNFELWNLYTIYSAGDWVVGSDGEFYVSLQNNNQNNDPTTSGGFWTKAELIRYYNANETYSENDMVRTADGKIYLSRVNSNTNNTPSENSTEWRSLLIRAWTSGQDFGQLEIVMDSVGRLWRSLIANNQGNNPETDDGSKWLAIGEQESLVQSGGGTLSPYRSNRIEDGSTYNLPAASLVPDGGWVIVEILDVHAVNQPTVQRSGTDNVADRDGNDTEVVFDTGNSVMLKFISNGVDTWEI